MKTAILALTLAGLAAGCTGDLDEQWDLDHDRIIALKASKPGLVAGETAEITGLLGHKGAKTDEAPPLVVIVPDLPNSPATPDALKASVHTDAGHWYVTCPDDATLAAVRTQLGLEATDPVPVSLGASYGQTLNALTQVRFGVDAQNPAITMPTIDGRAMAPGEALVIDSLVKVPLSVTLPDMQDINWLTGVGQMHDFDLPNAYLKVEKGDPTDGELAVVIRDRLGGVAWQVWSLTANPPPAM